MDIVILSELHRLIKSTLDKGSVKSTISTGASSAATILQFFVAGKYSDALQVEHSAELDC